MSKSVYSRIQEGLYEKLKAYSNEKDIKLSPAIEVLITVGLERSNEQDAIRNMTNELNITKEKLHDTENDNLRLRNDLESFKMKHSIALAAQSHVPELISEINDLKRQNQELIDYLKTQVATCRRCGNNLCLIDIGQKKCVQCGGWDPAWLPQYAPPPSPWETIRDGAAVVGGVTIVAALLDALRGNQS